MSSIEQIKITNLRSHMQIEWPSGAIHTWVPKGPRSWHNFTNRIGDWVPVYYSTKPGEGAGALQYDLDVVEAFCDLYNVTIAYAKGRWDCHKDRRLIYTHTSLGTLIAGVTKELSK